MRWEAAVAAMQGLLANPSTSMPHSVLSLAFTLADAMLKEGGYKE